MKNLFGVQSEECRVKRYDYFQDLSSCLGSNHTSELITQNSSLEGNHTSELITQNSSLEGNHTSELITLRSSLKKRVHAADIKRLSLMAEGERGNAMKAMLFSLAFEQDIRVASNALWVLTHLKRADTRWLQCRQQQLINRTMSVADVTSRRLLLTLLERLDFKPDTIRTDFLDFCLNRILTDTEPVGIRSLCVKLAYKMCRHYPELADELRQTLRMIPADASPGLRACCASLIDN